MQVDQALSALAQLKNAAPPATAARLNDMMALMQQLDEENVALSRQLSDYPIAEIMAQAFNTFRTEFEFVREQSETLRSGKLNGRATDQADCLQAISDHSASAVKLVGSLEEITALRRGGLQIDTLVFSGLDLLTDTWQLYHEFAEARKQHISVYADDPLPLVVGDYRYVLAVLCDLLENAIYYTLPGGEIRMTAETLGTHVLFSIADDGIGLSQEDMEHVGQPFWRALRQPLVREHPGSGMRLHVDKSLLLLHESELLFSGEPGVGSTFSFALTAG